MHHSSLFILGLLTATATASQAISPNPLRSLLKRQDDADEPGEDGESLRDDLAVCIEGMNDVFEANAPKPAPALSEWMEANPFTTPSESSGPGGVWCTMTYPASLSELVTPYYSSHTSWWSSISSALGGTFTYECNNATLTANLIGDGQYEGCSDGYGVLFTGPGITTFAPLDTVPSTTLSAASATPTSEALTSVVSESETTRPTTVSTTSPPEVTGANGASRLTGAAAAVIAAIGAIGALAL
ncbi:hypothetical protein BN1723_009708 [Verticillium longisporum]|uniref:Uncharacterized protein n=2 Tax=Verticillium longisporum TaxID=100787 RepID=A0A0G4KRW7_VERLO|nr:hypothetical protein BN1723_009708 [Verticillium longisporum]